MPEGTKLEMYPGADYYKSENIPENRIYQIVINGVELIASRIFTKQEIAERNLKTAEKSKNNELDRYRSALELEEIYRTLYGDYYKSQSPDEAVLEARERLKEVQEEKIHNPPNPDNQYAFVPDYPAYEIYIPAAEATFGFNGRQITDYFFTRAIILANRHMEASTIAGILKQETAAFTNKSNLDENRD